MFFFVKYNNKFLLTYNSVKRFTLDNAVTFSKHKYYQLF